MADRAGIGIAKPGLITRLFQSYSQRPAFADSANILIVSGFLFWIGSLREKSPFSFQGK